MQLLSQHACVDVTFTRLIATLKAFVDEKPKNSKNDNNAFYNRINLKKA